MSPGKWYLLFVGCCDNLPVSLAGSRQQGSGGVRVETDQAKAFTGLMCPFTLPFPSAISCGHPGVPANAVLTGELFTYGAVVHYACKGSGDLVGNSTRVCQEDSHWSGTLPHCTGEEPGPGWTPGAWGVAPPAVPRPDSMSCHGGRGSTWSPSSSSIPWRPSHFTSPLWETWEFLSALARGLPTLPPSVPLLLDSSSALPLDSSASLLSLPGNYIDTLRKK